MSERAAAVEVCAEVLFKAARDAGFWISPDLRVGLRDAARLLGLSPGHLRNLVSEGKGPPTYRLGGAGHRVTVHLFDLAEWRESRRM